MEKPPRLKVLLLQFMRTLHDREKTLCITLSSEERNEIGATFTNAEKGFIDRYTTDKLTDLLMIIIKRAKSFDKVTII